MKKDTRRRWVSCGRAATAPQMPRVQIGGNGGKDLIAQRPHHLKDLYEKGEEFLSPDLNLVHRCGRGRSEAADAFF